VAALLAGETDVAGSVAALMGRAERDE
jgi:hypothetical protein